LTGESILPEQLLALEDCSEPGHLKKLKPDIAERVIKENNTKCVDLTKANISGGTMEDHTEHIVVMIW